MFLAQRLRQSASKLSYEQCKQIRQDNLFPCMTAHFKEPLLIEKGEMQYLYDHNGKKYIDLFAGIVTVSVGHCHPRINKVLFEQAEKLWHTTQIYWYEGIHKYAKKIADKFPDGLDCVYFVNSGSEANDMAMMLARLHTGNWNIVALQNAYHGASPYTRQLLGHSTWKNSLQGSGGVHHIPNPCKYSGEFGNNKDAYLNQFENQLNFNIGKHLAGFFAEPLQGVGGSTAYADGYLKGAYELVREAGGVCISDEVQTGFGRCGTHFWGFETHGVVPDIVTMAKGIGNGFPMAAVVTTKEIASQMSKNLHFNTFAGNPLACAVGLEVLNIIEEDKLQDQCLNLGNHFISEMKKLQNKYDFIGDVRGTGLMLGIEMSENRNPNTPLRGELMQQLWEGMRENGVLVGRGGLWNQTFRIKPPMCITREDLDYSISVFDNECSKIQGMSL